LSLFNKEKKFEIMVEVIAKKAIDDAFAELEKTANVSAKVFFFLKTKF